MRLTLRIVKQGIKAVEYALDEIAADMRGTKYANDIAAIRIMARSVSRGISELLDRMIDENAEVMRGLEVEI